MILTDDEEKIQIELINQLEDVEQIRRLRIVIHNYEKTFKTKLPPKPLKFSMWDADMARNMDDYLKVALPDLKKRSPEMILKWAVEFRKLRKDYNEQKIIDVLSFAMHDKFWGSIIISPKKLRDKFDTLLAQLSGGSKSLI